MNRIFVYVEPARGRLTPVSLELVSGAASLGDALAGAGGEPGPGPGGSAVEVFVAGPVSDTDVALLGDHGADRVISVSVEPDGLLAPVIAGGIGSRFAEGAPSAVLLPGTCDGRDIGAALSVLVDRPVLANVVGLAADGPGIISEHAIFGGVTKVNARVNDDGPGIFLVRPGSFELCPGRGLSPITEQVVGVSASPARVLERREEAIEGPSLEDATVVVTGGRGLGSAERFGDVVELARLLGGAPGATRAIVDAGWAPYGLQVGQTGKTVKPDVYLAFGVSGATQHVVGMRNARHVVAVNTDEHAPIIALADLAVIGDAPAVLRRLIEALRAR